MIEEGIEILLVGLHDRPTATKYCGTHHEEETVTYTKEYTVGFKRADFDIPTLLWNLLWINFNIHFVLCSKKGGLLIVGFLQDVKESVGLNLRRIMVVL